MELEQRNPAWALKWLTRDFDEGNEILTAEDLEGLDLEQAALWVVTHLQEQILAR